MIKFSIMVTIFVIVLQELFGFYPFGRDPRTTQDLAFGSNPSPNCALPEGDEHIRYYRGHGYQDNSFFAEPTSKTPDGPSVK